MFLTIPQFIES